MLRADPSSITLSADYSKLVFTDIGAASFKTDPFTGLPLQNSKERKRQLEMEWPKGGSWPYDGWRAVDFRWDKWSVAVIMLELLYGSKVVASMQNVDQVREVVKESRRCLTEETYAVLLGLFGFQQEMGELLPKWTPWKYLKEVLETRRDHIEVDIYLATTGASDSTCIQRMMAAHSERLV